MNFKSILMGTAAAAMLATTASADPVTLRIQTHYATEHPTGQFLQRLIDDVQTMSGGDITIEMFYSSITLPPKKTVLFN